MFVLICVTKLKVINIFQ